MDRIKKAGFTLRVSKAPMPPTRMLSGTASAEVAKAVEALEGIEKVYSDTVKSVQ
jgi:hypothetical protein